MSHPKILGEVIHDLGHDVTAMSHAFTSALPHIHASHQPPPPPPATSQQEEPMAATLADAIHQAVTDAVSDILDRYLTLENLANATADAVNAQHAQPALPPPPAPVTPAADAPDAPDSAT